MNTLTMNTTTHKALSHLDWLEAESIYIMREVAGQDPHTSLGLGFVIVRVAYGATLTSADSIPAAAAIEIQFRDGRVATHHRMLRGANRYSLRSRRSVRSRSPDE